MKSFPLHVERADGVNGTLDEDRTVFRPDVFGGSFTQEYHYVSGRWYLSSEQSLASGGSHSDGIIRMMPVFIPQDISISDLGVNVITAGVGGHVQAAIYAADPLTLMPTTLIGATGDMVTDTTDPVSAAIVGGPVALAAGIYWMATQIDATAGTAAVAFATQLNSQSFLGRGIGDPNLDGIFTGNTATLNGMSFNEGTYGTWPDLTGVSGSVSATTATAVVAFKVA